MPLSSAKSPSGVPPSASIPKTADHLVKDSYRWRPPFGSGNSTEQLPCAVICLTQMQRNARLVDPLEITGTKIDIAFPQHQLCIRVSRLAPACERRRQRWSVA